MNENTEFTTQPTIRLFNSPAGGLSMLGSVLLLLSATELVMEVSSNEAHWTRFLYVNCCGKGYRIF